MLWHPWLQEEHANGFLPCWQESQVIWGVCKQHQGQSTAFFQAQPVQADEGETGTMWPKELLNMSPQKSICVWTGICQQLHQIMLDWHIMEKKLRLIQTVSAFCICGFPDRWTWLTTPNYQTECHFAMASANHASDFSVLTQDQHFPFSFFPPNRKLISNSIITKKKKSISQQIYVWKIQCYNYREIIILSFWGNVITAISSLGYSFTI